MHLRNLYLSKNAYVQVLLSFVYICIADCDPINWFNPATFLCLYQARTWISNVVFCVFSHLRREVIVNFVDIGVIVDHHCLNFFLLIFFLLVIL